MLCFLLDLAAFKRKSVQNKNECKKLQLTKLLLIIEVVSLAMHLVFQGEVKRDMLHSLLTESLSARFIFLLLDVFDHVREPHRQSVVAAKV